MIIRTTNKQLAAVMAGFSKQDGDAFTLYPLKAQELAQLAVILTTTYANQWSVTFDGQPTASYEDLTAGVDGANWHIFMLAPSEYGADTEDLINFIENVYGLPVDNDNWKQVAQLFRIWYAYIRPNEYRNPPSAKPAKYAELSLTNPADNASRSKRRRERQAQAAQRFGFDTIDMLVSAINAGTHKVVPVE